MDSVGHLAGGAGFWCRCTELICLEILFELSLECLCECVYMCHGLCREVRGHPFGNWFSHLVEEGGYLFGRFCCCTAHPGPPDPRASSRCYYLSFHLEAGVPRSQMCAPDFLTCILKVKIKWPVLWGKCLTSRATFPTLLSKDLLGALVSAVHE